MNLDIDLLHKLLQVESHLRGHPKLKPLHDHVVEQLNALATEDKPKEEPNTVDPELNATPDPAPIEPEPAPPESIRRPIQGDDHE